MIRNTIKEVMAEVFEIDVNEINNHATQKEIDFWDSLKHLNLMVELEEKFNMSFEPEEIGEMTSIDKIVEVIEGRQK